MQGKEGRRQQRGTQGSSTRTQGAAQALQVARQAGDPRQAHLSQPWPCLAFSSQPESFGKPEPVFVTSCKLPDKLETSGKPPAASKEPYPASWPCYQHCQASQSQSESVCMHSCELPDKLTPPGNGLLRAISCMRSWQVKRFCRAQTLLQPRNAVIAYHAFAADKWLHAARVLWGPGAGTGTPCGVRMLSRHDSECRHRANLSSSTAGCSAQARMSQSSFAACMPVHYVTHRHTCSEVVQAHRCVCTAEAYLSKLACACMLCIMLSQHVYRKVHMPLHPLSCLIISAAELGSS